MTMIESLPLLGIVNIIIFQELNRLSKLMTFTDRRFSSNDREAKQYFSLLLHESTIHRTFCKDSQSEKSGRRASVGGRGGGTEDRRQPDKHVNKRSRRKLLETALNVECEVDHSHVRSLVRSFISVVRSAIRTLCMNARLSYARTCGCLR